MHLDSFIHLLNECIYFINISFSGVGYHLILSKAVEADPNIIFQSIQKYVAEATLESAISAECKILLPHGASAKFPALFEELEKCKDSLQVYSIGLSETSIEEVFMKMYDERLYSYFY